MPYLKAASRKYFEEIVCAIVIKHIASGGDLNYLFSELINRYLTCTDRKYENYNTVIGALECAKQEVYRRLIGPYEDTKIKENGEVFK